MFKRLLGGDRKGSSAEPTFEQRSRLFWEWFSERAPVYYQAIEDQNFEPHTAEVSAKMDEILPGMAWVFGPGENEVGHSFTISPEGDPYKAILLSHLIKRAPQIDGWTFYDSRQPSQGFRGMKMKIAGEEVGAEQIWITPTVDVENEEIDLVCWSPVFEGLPEGDRGQITFLWLDESLGEFQVSNRIGSIDINSSALEQAMPLTELPEYVEEVESREKWERRTPGEYYVGYKMSERADFLPDFPRCDIFYGTSLLWQLSRDFAREDGELEHPLPELGVEFVYIKIPREELTEGKEVDERSELEDRLMESFVEPYSGICLGGATGTESCYLDIVITDGPRGIEALRQVLGVHRLGKRATVHFFNKEKSSQSVL